MAYDPELAERALAAVASHASLKPEEITEKLMFGGVCYLVRGAMAVGVLGEKLVIRVAPDDAARYVDGAHVRPMDFTGRPMKGWLYVESPAVADEAAMRRWVERSVDFVLARAVAKKRSPKKASPKKRAPGR